MSAIGSAFVPSVPEIPVEAAVGGEIFPIMRWLGKIQVLFDWMGQVHSVVPVGVVMTIDLSFIVLTIQPEAVRDPRLTSLTADLGTK